MTSPEIAKIIPIANSKASNSHRVDTPKIVDALRRQLKHIRVAPLIDVGTEGTDVTDQALGDLLDDPWLPKRKTLVLLFGGDGLKTTQINTFIRSIGPMHDIRSTGILFGHVTTGEFNLDQERYGIQPDTDSIVKAITTGSVTEIDSMRGVIAGGESFIDQTFFHSLGLFSYFVQGYEDARQHVRGKYRKVLQAASHALREYKLGQVTVRDQGMNELFNGMAGLVEIGKGNLAGIKFTDRKQNDSRMSVLVVPGSTMGEFITNLVIGGFLAINHPGDNSCMRQFTGFADADVLVRDGTIWHYDAEMGTGLATQVDVSISEDYRVPFLTSGIVYRHQ